MMEVVYILTMISLPSSLEMNFMTLMVITTYIEVESQVHSNSMYALANIFGGMSHLVHSLGECTRSYSNEVQAIDIIGSLDYELKVFNKPGSIDLVNVVEIEILLIKKLKQSISRFIQICAVEAFAYLYGNAYLH
jgi:hypothetical protein